jgi:hypothetical protein
VDYTKYPSGIMCDSSYVYVQGDRNGIIYRYDKTTGDREDLPGIFPMASPFEVGEGNSFAANIEFSSDHSTENGYFWILSWYNKKIYEVYYWDSDITNKSLGSIKALFE